MHIKLNYTFLYLIPLVLSAILSLRSFWQKWPKPFRLFSIYLVIDVVFEFFAIWWTWRPRSVFPTYNKWNLWVYNLNLVISQFIMLIFFYYILRDRKIRKYIIVAILLTVPFSVFNYFSIQGPHVVNSYSIVLLDVTALILGTSYFFQVLHEDRIIKLGKDPLTWILMGRFLYTIFTVNMFLTYGYLINQSPKTITIFLHINDSINLLSYTFYIIAFLCKPHPKQPSTQSLYPVS